MRGLYSDIKLVRFGVREVADYINEQGWRGFKLNGKKILIRGGGWTDDILLDNRPKKVAAEVAYARHMNLNALRVEGFFGSSQQLLRPLRRERPPDHGRLELPVGVGELFRQARHREIRRDHLPRGHQARGRVLEGPGPLAPEPPEHLRLDGGERPPARARSREGIHRHPEGGRPDPAGPHLGQGADERADREDRRSRCAGPTIGSRRPTGTSTQKNGGAFGFNTETGPGPPGPAHREPEEDDPREGSLAHQRHLVLPLQPRRVQHPRHATTRP